jgi:RNA-directed DNA polymerase
LERSVCLPWSRLGPDRPGALLSGQARARIREAVARSRQGKPTALLHHIDVAVLRASFFGLKKSAAPGVDEMTWAKYAETLEANLVDLGGW